MGDGRTVNGIVTLSPKVVDFEVFWLKKPVTTPVRVVNVPV